MSSNLTNEDKMLQAVLSNKELIKEYGINPNEFTTIQNAYYSENPVISAIAIIIKDMNDEGICNQKELYKKIINVLNNNLL